MAIFNSYVSLPKGSWNPMKSQILSKSPSELRHKAKSFGSNCEANQSMPRWCMWVTWDGLTPLMTSDDHWNMLKKGPFRWPSIAHRCLAAVHEPWIRPLKSFKQNWTNNRFGILTGQPHSQSATAPWSMFPETKCAASDSAKAVRHQKASSRPMVQLNTAAVKFRPCV